MIYLGKVGGISALKSRGIQVYFVFAVYNGGGGCWWEASQVTSRLLYQTQH